MKLKLDPQTVWLAGGVIGLLLVSSATGWWLGARASSETVRATVQNLQYVWGKLLGICFAAPAFYHLTRYFFT